MTQLGTIAHTIMDSRESHECVKLNFSFFQLFTHIRNRRKRARMRIKKIKKTEHGYTYICDFQ